MNILIVDDEPAVREVITRLLSLDGHNVTQAASGADGVTDFQRTVTMSWLLISPCQVWMGTNALPR